MDWKIIYIFCLIHLKKKDLINFFFFFLKGGFLLINLEKYKKGTHFL